MAPRYQQTHSIDAIIESPDEDLAGSRGAGRTHAISDKKRRDDNPSSPTSTTSARTKEKSRKSHHTSFGGRVVSKSKPKANSAKRYAAHDESQLKSLVRQHPRHTRREAESDSSSSSEEDEEENPKDYRAVLAAARGRLTSPSLLSTMTSLTTATNNSGGSSGSNSTITQASMSRGETEHEVTISGTTEEEEEGPMSPAAPDPPNVFAYLDEDSSSSDEDEEEDSDADENENENGEVQYAPHAPSPAPHSNDEDTPDYDADSHSDPNDSDGADDSHSPQQSQPQTTWLNPLSPTSSADDATPLAPTFRSSHPRTPSLSSASSFTASDTSSPADIDTDRSTSPEHSLKGSPTPTPRLLLSRPPANAPPASPTEAKLAAQMRAAQMRQDQHSSSGGYNYHHRQQHTPTPLSLHPPPHQDAQAISARNPRSPPPSGYDALATHLTTSPPVYRRFATLNHRLLLHMQDELSELEAHLAAIDAADAASRTLSLPPTPSSAVAKSPGRRSRREMKTYTHPSSRRVAAQHPSQLDHHRADLLARVGYKMAQYNASLTSFAKTSRLPAAEEADVDAYRAFLANTQPVVPEEARFLDQGGDLISLAPPPPPAPVQAVVAPSQVEESGQGKFAIQSVQMQQPHTQRALLLAALASILLPVLMFTVVPNFVGRIAVAVLVAGLLWGMVGAQGAVMKGLVGGSGGWGLVWGWGAGILVAAVVV